MIQSTGFRAAVLATSEITRHGITLMLNSQAIVKEVAVWAWESIPHTSSPTAYQDLDLLVMEFADVEIGVLDRVAREAARHDVKVLLVLNQPHEEMLDIIAAIPNNGVLVQDELSTDSLAAAIERVADGDTPIPAALAKRLLSRARAGTLGPAAGSLSLTPREKQVLQLLVEGLSNKQIATRLHISQHGVKRHVSSVLAKLGCSNRTLAVAVAISKGILAE